MHVCGGWLGQVRIAIKADEANWQTIAGEMALGDMAVGGLTWYLKTRRRGAGGLQLKNLLGNTCIP